MKICGKLNDILLQVNSEKHKDFACNAKIDKVLYVTLKMALCRILKSCMLCCWKFRKDIEKLGYQINPHETCAANKIINSK